MKRRIWEWIFKNDTFVVDPEIGLYRALLVFLGIAYPLWGILVRYLEPKAYDPLILRLGVSAIAFVILLLSYLKPLIRKHFYFFFVGILLIGTGQFFYVAQYNTQYNIYDFMAYVVVIGVGLTFRGWRSLTIHLLTIASLIALFIPDDQDMTGPVALGAFACIYVLLFIIVNFRMRSLARLDRANMLLKTQHEALLALSGEVDLDQALCRIVDMAIKLARMDCGGIYLVDLDSGSLSLVYQQGLPEGFVCEKSFFTADSNNAKLVMLGKPIYSIYRDIEIPMTDEGKKERLLAIGIIPICYQNRVLGCINVASHMIDEVEEPARAVLEAIAASVGNAIARMQAEQRMTKIRQRMVMSARLVSIGQLAAGLAHEINNPLAIIRGNIELLAESCDEGKLDPLTCKPILEKQQRSVDRIAMIIRSLRSYARGDVHIQQCVDMHSMVEETLGLVGALYAKEGIVIERDFKAAQYKVTANFASLQQAFLSILSNARDALEGRDERLIRIATFNRGRYVALAVTDTGCGIAKDRLGQVFVPFYTTKDPGKGKGLELSIAYGIITELGGAIEVASEDGKGACFTLSFPIREAGSESLIPAKAA